MATIDEINKIHHLKRKCKKFYLENKELKEEMKSYDVVINALKLDVEETHEENKKLKIRIEDLLHEIRNLND